MRIAIVSGSGLVIEILRHVVSLVPRHQVAWVASTGADAVKRVAVEKPDLILMDLFLPGVDGSQVTRMLMKEHPCAVLIVTEKLAENPAKVFEAMGSGALDASSTPAFTSDGKVEGAESLLVKIATIEKLIGKERGNGRNQTGAEGLIEKAAAPLIAVGSSTGGPKALSELLSGLPEKPGAPVVIVQHVDVQFAGSLADWLSGRTRLKVTLAKSDSRPQGNTVYVAGTNDHLVIGADLAFHYVEEPKECPYRPSVDAFFQSLVRYWPGKGVAVLLTGMGGDGARGLLELRKAGWYTIAQDQKTSVVYGMPKAAAELKAAMEILPIEKIAEAVTKKINAKEGVWT
ncbi:MAG: chemotaxis-specific protein-glutamate methyltransferase CheB [Desulfobacteraceae bacterium]|nr:MAG: chemotaxis-specific protein-glutamate methyltransferase CheB [Desulfobacteraceae bacterium]